ncbi:hypothetical protein AXF42_Ash016981 [Apostasia shenzhenica]|uniref:RRM domain-containing protein n=1 Tax=Apostasia shenzhenica TaxID=1088818 RepID=A0A2I0B7B9_9ASPA|nr:hypothetical protein AXF42_Ash016981 [Apostasia shenzhenica]
MAILLPNPKPSSSLSLPSHGNLISRSISRHAHCFNRDKLMSASSNSFCRLGGFGNAFALRLRRRTAAARGSSISGSNGGDRDEEHEEDEEGEFMPLTEMVWWLQNKPAGFGEGKIYDTSVEDKLLEEKRCDRVREERKPRGKTMNSSSGVQKQERHRKDVDVIASCTRVRVSNLPKKKNIKRDLWKAFKGFSGIVDISPAVTGNRKTRDPICKGFAFIGLESDDAAYRFVRTYSNKNLLFGKIQKEVSCDVLSAVGDTKTLESSKCKASSYLPKLSDSENEIPIPHGFDICQGSTGIPVVVINETEFPLRSGDANPPSSANEVGEMKSELSIICDAGFTENESEVDEDLQLNNSTASHPTQGKVVLKKRGKRKPIKSAKLHISSSLARLKIKERAVLTDVFSKYREVASASSNES